MRLEDLLRTNVKPQISLASRSRLLAASNEDNMLCLIVLFTYQTEKNKKTKVVCLPNHFSARLTVSVLSYASCRGNS